MAQKPALGKGLASLFPGVPGVLNSPVPPFPAFENTDSISRDRHPGISLASPDEIQTNPYQPRREFNEPALEELTQSIRTNGVIQPIVVRKAPNGGFQLIAGERRLRAAKLAGLKQIPIVIRRSTDKEALELALVENIQRQNLNCVEEALAYSQLIDEFFLTQEEVAQRVGKDRASVANHLRVLKLPQSILEDLKTQVLSFGHGKALLSLEKNEDKMLVRGQIIDKKLSVRESEVLIEKIKNHQTVGTTHSEDGPVRSRLGAASLDLIRKYSTKVEIRGSEKKGKIQFYYSSRQELDRILETLQKVAT